MYSNGKKISYYVNEFQSWLILKDSELLDHTRNFFHDTGIKVHLGAFIDNDYFKNKHVSEKVADWTQQMLRLTEYAKTWLHAAYGIFCRGVVHKVTYFVRTIQEMNERGFLITR